MGAGGSSTLVMGAVTMGATRPGESGVCVCYKQGRMSVVVLCVAPNCELEEKKKACETFSSVNHSLLVTYFHYTLSKQQASVFPLLSQNNNRAFTVEPPFSDAKSTQLDILKFVFMSVCYLSALSPKIGQQHPAVMLKVQSSFPSEGHNTV